MLTQYKVLQLNKRFKWVYVVFFQLNIAIAIFYEKHMNFIYSADQTFWIIRIINVYRAEPTCYRTYYSYASSGWAFWYIVLRVMLLTYTWAMIRFSNCGGLSGMTSSSSQNWFDSCHYMAAILLIVTKSSLTNIFYFTWPYGHVVIHCEHIISRFRFHNTNHQITIPRKNK